MITPGRRLNIALRVGQNIKIARLAMHVGCTQKDAAKELGITQGTYSRIEGGFIMPDACMLITLARMYGVSVNELCDV